MNLSAVYAGTFDPITLGHMDVIERASKIFDRLIVAVAASTHKATLFTVEERIRIVRGAVKTIPRVEVDSFSGLLIDYVHAKGIRVLVRGMRAYADFEVEFQMALTNRKMSPDTETVFLMPKEDYSYVSSSMVREIAEHGGATDRFVPPVAQTALQNKFRKT